MTSHPDRAFCGATGTPARDLTVTLCAPEPSRLFEDLAAATFSLLADLRSVVPREPRIVWLKGGSRSELLNRWLRTLVVQRAGETRLYSRFRVVRIGRGALASMVWGEPLDRSRHHLRREPGSLMPHGGLVRRGRNEWSGRICFELDRASLFETIDHATDRRGLADRPSPSRERSVLHTLTPNLARTP